MIQFPNRTVQAGTFKTGTPNYVDVSSGSADTGMQTFPDAATTDGWADGDLIGVLVYLSASVYQVWVGQWDETNEYILCHTVESSVGTMTDDDAIKITATPTTETLNRWHAERAIATVLSF